MLRCSLRHLAAKGSGKAAAKPTATATATAPATPAAVVSSSKKKAAAPLNREAEAAAKAAYETALVNEAPAVHRVPWNAVAAARVAHVNRRFEAFKALYEAPIAERYAAVVAPRVARERETRRVERRLEARVASSTGTGKNDGVTLQQRMRELDAWLAAHAAKSPTPQQETLLAQPLAGVRTLGQLAKAHDELLTPAELSERITDELRSLGIRTRSLGNADDVKIVEDADDVAELAAGSPFVLITSDRRFDASSADSQFKKDEAMLRQRRVVLLVRVEALQLPVLAEERLIELAGLRYDPEVDTIKVSADAFERRSDNTYAALRTMKELINEAFLADSNYVPPARAADGSLSPFEAAAKEEADWLAHLRAKGAAFTSPLEIGPALAPIAFMERVQNDIDADTRAAAGATLAAEQPRLRLFHFDAVPSEAERADADQRMAALVAELEQQQQQQQQK